MSLIYFFIAFVHLSGGLPIGLFWDGLQFMMAWVQPGLIFTGKAKGDDFVICDNLIIANFALVAHLFVTATTKLANKHTI